MDIVWQAEDSLREKKLESDLKDLLKTLVAFANSVAPGDTAKIFIGECDDGTVQGVTNPDSIQKTVKKEADKIYPEIYFKTVVYENDSKQCVRVEIKRNGLAPHFGGAAWVRKGTETIRATDELYQQMVEFRQDKVRELFRWLKQDITVEGSQQRAFLADPYITSEWSVGTHNVTLEAVNSHWVTFKLYSAPRIEKSEPMEKLLLSWDDDRRRLKVVVKNWTRTA